MIMKYLILPFFLLMFCSCGSDDINANKFTYAGHSYIKFSCSTKYGFEVLHDPNCECFTSKISDYD